MTAVNTLTGRLGKFVVGVTLVARATQWAVNPTLATSTEWGDSDSAGFTNFAAGRKACSFTAEGKFDTTNEVYDLFQPEDVLVAVLWLNNTTLYWDFPIAVCADFNLTVNIDTEEILGWTSSWNADGVFYHPGEVGATVRVLP